jgi:phosphoribosyl 1,2-cyclic phosphate phosphodiesterase
LRTSIMLEANDRVVVVDSGPDFRQQMLREGVTRLDAVIFTHAHKDHIAGLDDVRPFNHRQQSATQIYATKEVQKAIKREFYYCFDEHRYPGAPDLALNTIQSETFSASGIQFTPLPVMHMDLPILGFRVGNFVYITDSNYIPEETYKLIGRPDVLVLNALRHTPHPSHFNLSEAIAVVNQIKPKRAFFTHISHQLGLHDEVSAQLPSHIQLAYDGLTIIL